MIPKWNKIPENMHNVYVKKQYEILMCKRKSLILKRLFDVFVSLLMIILLAPILAIVAIIIKIDSKGPAIYMQERATQYGNTFKVYKFRTMIDNADKIGGHITADKDPRITRVGSKIRDYRIDELPQLFNILSGEMSFVGTRPEAIKYVSEYTDEMKVTLLLPAGVTSKASIKFRNEAELLKDEQDIDRAYISKVLPQKMNHNIEYIEKFGFLSDIKIMFETVVTVLR